jgi:hypothetical protein
MDTIHPAFLRLVNRAQPRQMPGVQQDHFLQLEAHQDVMDDSFTTAAGLPFWSEKAAKLTSKWSGEDNKLDDYLCNTNFLPSPEPARRCPRKETTRSWYNRKMGPLLHDQASRMSPSFDFILAQTGIEDCETHDADADCETHDADLIEAGCPESVPQHLRWRAPTLGRRAP